MKRHTVPVGKEGCRDEREGHAGQTPGVSRAPWRFASVEVPSLSNGYRGVSSARAMGRRCGGMERDRSTSTPLRPGHRAARSALWLRRPASPGRIPGPGGPPSRPTPGRKPRYLEGDRPFGEGARLVGEQDLDVAQVLDGNQALTSTLFAARAFEPADRLSVTMAGIISGAMPTGSAGRTAAPRSGAVTGRR
jgi:hypothetical protein